MQSTEELKKELMYSSLELESVKCKVTESQENVSNLLNLLEVAYQERDEARNQLKNIFEKINPSSTPVGQLHANHLEFANINMPNSSTMGFVNVMKQPTMVQQFNPNTTNVTMSAQTDDLASQIVDDFAKGKTLPQIGKLMQAVKEAGPLLQTLLIAGPPLPRWRNPPPPLQQPFKIPPVSMVNGYTRSFNQKPFANSNPTTSYYNVAQTSSAANAMMSFETGFPSAAVSCFDNSMVASSSGFDHQIPIAKRRRVQ
ncbi:hypothetical protein ACLB2K_070977 [Fragaria x ananassa]